MIKEIDSDELKEYIKNSKFLVVFFYVDWCGQSIMSNQLFDDIEKKYSNEKIDFLKINSDKNYLWENEKNGQWVITKSPTFLFFLNGKEVHRLEEFKNEKEITKILKDKFYEK